MSKKVKKSDLDKAANLEKSHKKTSKKKVSKKKVAKKVPKIHIYENKEAIRSDWGDLPEPDDHSWSEHNEETHDMDLDKASTSKFQNFVSYVKDPENDPTVAFVCFVIATIAFAALFYYF